MAEREQYLPFIPMFIVLAAESMIFVFPGLIGLVIYMCSYAGYGTWIYITIKLAGPLASKYQWINFRPTSRSGPNGWKWRGPFNLKFRAHPQSIGYLPDYIRPDGTGRGAYVTPMSPYKNSTRHPSYNQKGKLKMLIMVHPYPYELQFKQVGGSVFYLGTAARTQNFAWCVADEVMPGKTYWQGLNQNTFKSVLNHVPYIDLDLYHNPVFYVSNSSGLRDIKEREMDARKVREAVQRPMVAALARGGQTLLCLECGSELPHQDPDGKAACPNPTCPRHTKPYVMVRPKFTTEEKKALK